MTWQSIESTVQELYRELGSVDRFEADRDYLKGAFEGVEALWDAQFDSMSEVRYLMFSEAPLWQNRGNYFYNPEAKLTQFLYKNDIGVPFGVELATKIEMLDLMREIGFLLVDCSPLAFSQGYSSFTYGSLSQRNYRRVMSVMIDVFLREKLSRVKEKCSDKTVLLFRYKRVEQALKADLQPMLQELGFNASHFVNIGKNGGGVDRDIVREMFGK